MAVPDGVALRPLAPADRDAYRALRLRALAEEPAAFTSSFAEASASAERWSTERLLPRPDANVIVGAFDAGGALVGIVGIERFERQRERHKALLYGMYVAPEAAGRGVGRALVEAAVATARRWPGLRRIGLTVTRGNDRARRLYAAAGFVTWGVEAEAVGLGDGYVDKEHMALALGDGSPAAAPA